MNARRGYRVVLTSDEIAALETLRRLRDSGVVLPDVRVCPHCGSSFVAKRADTKWCTKTCAVAACQERNEPPSHGTTGYKYGCRCDECHAAVNAYQKKRYAKKHARSAS